MPNHIIIIGPAHPLRGGLASFNERLAQEYISQGHTVVIYTFSLQYPTFLFPGTTQYSTEPAPVGIPIKVCINSINPFNWIRVGLALKKTKPNLIIVRYWMPFMAPCLGTILRIVVRNRFTKILCIADNVVPHERKFYDNAFTTYFVKPITAFVTMSHKVLNDLVKFTSKSATVVTHPLYDSFGEAVAQPEAKAIIQIDATKKTLLFFGFIRKYKGLDLLLEAVKIIKDTNTQLYHNIQLIIAGEYYEDETKYTELIRTLDIADAVKLQTHYIPDSEVKYYLCSADVVVQPYRNATQSGVTPLAYHYNIPMIVTNVGALASNVPHGIVGLVCNPTPQDIAQAIIQYFSMDKNEFVQNIKEEKKQYSWLKLTEAIKKITS